MSPPFVIRQARTDELSRLGELMVAVYANLDGFPSPTEQPAYYELLADIGRFAGLPDTELVVAATDTALLGGVVYFSDVTRYGAGIAMHDPETSAFRLLAVDPAARGLGVGKALAEACIARAAQRGHGQVVIHTTRAMTVAWGMYERLGFVRSPALDFRQDDLPVFGFRLRL